MKEKQQLYVPYGIKTRPEIIEGFGKNELKNALIIMAFVLAIIVFELLFKANETIVVVTAVSGLAASFMLSRSSEGVMSVMDISKQIIVFINEQRIYPYRYAHELEVKGVKGNKK